MAPSIAEVSSVVPFVAGAGKAEKTIRLETPMFCTQRGDRSNKLYPVMVSALQLTVCFLDDPGAPIRRLIQAAAEEWANGAPYTFKFNEPASTALIRIGFSSAPSGVEPGFGNWAYVGTQAQNVGQSNPTMNFDLSGWSTRGVVFSQAHISRLARHMFGHALGFSHAPSSDAYNEASLLEHCKKMLDYHSGFVSDSFSLQNGATTPNSSQSIMHIDVPSHLAASGVAISRGSSSIEQEALDQLKAIYTVVPKPFCEEFQGKAHVPQHSIREGNYMQWNNSAHRYNCIASLTQLDISHDFHLRAQAITNVDHDAKILATEVSTWSDSWMYSGRVRVLSFLKEDERIQTGQKYLTNIRSPEQATPGEQRGIRIDFDKNKPQFRTVPRVTAFLCKLDLNNIWTRIDITVTHIDSTGFTLWLRTYADTTLYDLGACWIAYESDEPNIRSGSFGGGINHARAMSQKGTTLFSSPMLQAPRALFVGYSHIDQTGQKHMRISLTTGAPDANGFSWDFSTWAEESIFGELTGNYIAIL